MSPYSLDIFEGLLYWISKDKGEIWKQDKFGQEEKEKMLVVNPWLTQARIFHQHRYDRSGNHQPWNKMILIIWNPYLKLMAILLENGSGL